MSAEYSLSDVLTVVVLRVWLVVAENMPEVVPSLTAQGGNDLGGLETGYLGARRNSVFVGFSFFCFFLRLVYRAVWVVGRRVDAVQLHGFVADVDDVVPHALGHDDGPVG